MKTIATSLVLVILTVAAATGQSKSYITFKEKFAGLENVHSFSTSGFLARTILRLAEEDEVISAVKKVHKIRLVTVPRKAFEYEKVTVDGFRKVLRDDAFDELATIRDGGDNIYIYQQATTKNDNRYAVLVVEHDNVVLIEMCGYIDTAALAKATTHHKTE